MTDEPPTFITDEPPAFVCEDCGIAVYYMVPLSANDNETKCMTCRWIANAPETERPKLRLLLNHEPGKES